MIHDLVRQTRTVRRFQEEKVIDENVLRDCIDMARLGGSARNGQSLKYLLVTDKQLRAQLFPLLAWAGYLPHWPGPEDGERPSAYVICLLDTTLQKGPETEAHFDLGIATQNLLLGAAELGVFGCRIGAFSPEKVQQLFKLPEQYKALLVVSLGYPAEEVVLEKVGADGDIRYWHDEQNVHHVPKRKLADLLLASSDFTEE
ncbi:MAG: nitroreductase family protein [Desulfobulbus sp.]